MSLPMPAPFVPPTLSPEEQEVWEKLWIVLAQKSGGDLRLLLHSFFSFLHGKTDFYITHHPLDVKEGVSARMGFVEGDAEKLLLASFRRFPLRRLPRMSEIQKQKQKQQQQQQQEKAKERSSTKDETKDVKEVSTGNTNISSDAKHKTSTNQEERIESKSVKKGPLSTTSSSSSNIRFTEEGKQIPIGNGGADFDFNFQWTQTIQEVSIALPLPAQTRAKDLDVKIKHTSISVEMKATASSNDQKEKKDGSSTLLEGILNHGIRTDESTWTIEDNVMLIVLDKKEKTWWDTVFPKTDASSNDQNKNIIDTALIDSTSKISEYDHATQGMIRKIIFDQREERLGRKKAVAKKKNADADVRIPAPGEKVPPLPPGVEYIDNSNFPSKSNGDTATS